MSVPISNILKDHEIRLRKMESENGGGGGTGVSVATQNASVDLSKVEAELKALRTENAGLRKRIDDLNDLHSLFHLEFLRFKQEIDERNKVELEIVDSENGDETVTNQDLQEELVADLQKKDNPVPVPASEPVPEPEPTPEPTADVADENGGNNGEEGGEEKGDDVEESPAENVD
jgi:cell division protein FtsB